MQLRQRYRPPGQKPGLLLSHGEPGRGGDDLKGPESGDLKGPRSRLDSRAKLGELKRGGTAPLAGSILARSGVCSSYWLAHAALGGASAPAEVCSRGVGDGVSKDCSGV